MNIFPPLDERLEWSVAASRLEAWAPAWDKTKTVTFLDLGPGSLGLRLEHWARRRRCQVEVVKAADPRPLAKEGRKFSYVIGSMFLQRMPFDELPDMLRTCDSLATRGILFTDVKPGPAELEIAADLAGLGYLRVRRGPFSRLSLAGERH